MGRFYVDRRKPDKGSYEVFEGAEGARWCWVEVAQGTRYEDFGPWFDSTADAYRDAAYDWELNGDGSDKRLSGLLKAAATRAARAVS